MENVIQVGSHQSQRYPPGSKIQETKLHPQFLPLLKFAVKKLSKGNDAANLYLL